VLIAKLSERSHHFEELGRAIDGISQHASLATLPTLPSMNCVGAV
jgi:hypothetical protein